MEPGSSWDTSRDGSIPNCKIRRKKFPAIKPMFALPYIKEGLKLVKGIMLQGGNLREAVVMGSMSTISLTFNPVW